jgi:hypothetical protein
MGQDNCLGSAKISIYDQHGGKQRKQGCKPPSGGFDGQLMEQRSTYRARFVALDIALVLMKAKALRAILFNQLRVGLRAALGGTVFASWVPPLLLISFMLSNYALRWNLFSSPLDEIMRGMLFAFYMGGLAFLNGSICLVLLGFPTLLLLWLLQLRAPIFSAVAAVLVVVILGHNSRADVGDDLMMFAFFAVVTGFIAGLYARRCGIAALGSRRSRRHEL